MERWRVCLFPVRRRLALAAIFWLAGVALGTRFACPVLMALVLCALLALAAVLCRRRRRSAFFVVLLTALLLGNTWTGIRIGRRDAATSPGAELSGTVAAKLSDRRVLLTDVRVEGGQAPSRPVLVTLMLG